MTGPRAPAAGRPDAIVVGSGPNGLAAAVVLARVGWSVLVREATETVGGGVRSGELTLPGYTHDVCAAVHPLGASSPLFRSLPLAEHGLAWVHPPVPLDRSPTAAFGLTLVCAGHAVGWLVARGGSQRIADVLVSYLRSLGGEVQTGAPAERIEEAEGARATPRRPRRSSGTTRTSSAATPVPV